MLYEEEENFQKAGPDVERFRRGSGQYVLIRVRNRADLNEFADAIDVPQLKAAKVNSWSKITWSRDEKINNPLADFME